MTVFVVGINGKIKTLILNALAHFRILMAVADYNISTSIIYVADNTFVGLISGWFQ